MLQKLIIGLKYWKIWDDDDDIDNNINEKWESIKTIIKETKQQLQKRMKVKKH